MILDCLDRDKKYIKHRLYRQHISFYSGGFVKDISRVGRDLTKIIIIDNTPENFKLQQHNGLAIKTWTDDIRDTQLLDLERILTDISYYKVTDVRPIVRKIKDEIIVKYSKNTNPYQLIEVKKLLNY